MNALYDVAARTLMNGQFAWPDTEMLLVAWAGTPLFVPTHVTVADLRTATGGLELGYSLPITERTVAVDGTGQTNQVVIPGVPVGPDVTWLTLCKTKASIDLAELILFVDEAFGLPFITNGLDLVVQPDWVQARGWFRP